MLRVEISYADMRDMQLANDLSGGSWCNCGYSLACMSCPWRPNTWEKVAGLQVRVSSMVVPLAHTLRRNREEGDEGRSATLRHIKTEKGNRGKERKKKREKRGACLWLQEPVCDLW